MDPQRAHTRLERFQQSNEGIYPLSTNFLPEKNFGTSPVLREPNLCASRGSSME